MVILGNFDVHQKSVTQCGKKLPEQRNTDEYEDR